MKYLVMFKAVRGKDGDLQTEIDSEIIEHHLPLCEFALKVFVEVLQNRNYDPRRISYLASWDKYPAPEWEIKILAITPLYKYGIGVV